MIGALQHRYAEIKVQLLDRRKPLPKAFGPGAKVSTIAQTTRLAQLQSALVPAYVFPLPSINKKKPGRVSQCKLSYSFNESAFVGILAFEVPGLTFAQALEIKNNGFIQMLGGYVDVPGREPRTIFYGTIDTISPRFEFGKMRWAFTAKAAMNELFSVRIPISGTTNASSGQVSQRFKASDALDRIGTFLGIRIVYPRYFKGIEVDLKPAPGFVQPGANLEDLVAIPNYADNATVFTHIKNIVSHVQSAVKERFGIERRIVYAADASDMEPATARILIADLDMSENMVFLDVDMDSRFIPSGGPVFTTDQKQEMNEEGDVETQTLTAQEFSLVQHFNPDMTPHAIVRSKSAQAQALWIWKATEIQHDFPASGEWRTQASGPLQREQNEVVA